LRLLKKRIDIAMKIRRIKGLRAYLLKI